MGAPNDWTAKLAKNFVLRFLTGPLMWIFPAEQIFTTGDAEVAQGFSNELCRRRISQFPIAPAPY